MKRKDVLIIALIFLAPLMILLSRQLFDASYFSSSIYKIIFLTPILFRILGEKVNFKDSLTKHFSLDTFRNNFGKMLLIGIGLLTIYLFAFWIAQGYLDLNMVINQLQAMASINIGNIILIGLYIIVLNSLLEEFFWRGFVFDELKDSLNIWFAYIFTGLAFSFHHVVFYYSWFSLGFGIIITLGLTSYAIIMNLIFHKYKDLFSCWLVHAIADVAQILIAFRIFGII